MSFPNQMTGGEALARMLIAHEAGPMFGMGGFQLLPFYDAARRLGLQHSLINDERLGAFAADAYAKVTGRVGLVDATLGPGATNLVTGLVEALNAGTPMVAVAGDSHRAHSWKNMTQECRQAEILRPACKELIRVEDIARIPELTRRAFRVATSGRPGPVVLQVPEDIAHDMTSFAPDEFEGDPRCTGIPAVRSRPAAEDAARAARMLAQAERPLMLCGGGVHLSGAAPAVAAFAEATGIPVAHTMTGKGAVACISRHNAGLFGRYDRIANKLIEESDLLFVVGCKLGEIATKRYTVPGPGARVIHLDNVAEEFGRTLEPELTLWGDVRESIEDLQGLMAGDAPRLAAARAPYIDDVAARMAEWRRSVDARLTSEEVPINMARMMHELNGLLPAEAALIADGGFAAHWGGLLFDTKAPGRAFVPDRGFASIGYGLPGCMGAVLGKRALGDDGPVVGITGDGGFNMTLGELETARRMNLGFTLMVVNNAASGYVKALQHLMYGEGAYQSSDLRETNYARIAAGFDCQGVRVERPEDLAPAIRAGLAERDRPTILDVVVTRDPAKMLPAVDNRAAQARKGDRVA